MKYRDLATFVSTGAVALGCASQQQYTEVAKIVTEVRADEVSATVKYRNKVVALHGRVIKKGMKSARATKVEGVNSGWGWSGTAQNVSKNYGYVVLGSDAGSTSEAICLFEPETLETLAPVKEGQLVKPRCVFSMIVGERDARKPAFSGCTVDS